MASRGHLVDVNKAVHVKTHSTAATSDVDSDSVDMAGYNGVMFRAYFGTPAANNLIKVQQSSDNGSADDWSDVAGTSVASGSSNTVFVDVYRPTKRYVRIRALRGTSSTLESIWADRYDARSLPQTNTVSETHLNPAEGTA
jgi:hypothetical protein